MRNATIRRVLPTAGPQPAHPMDAPEIAACGEEQQAGRERGDLPLAEER